MAKAKYAADPELAKKMADSPELAAWAVVGNVLLNLDETLMRR